MGHRALGSSWLRPEKVKATSSFACQLQSTHKDLSRVDLDLPERLVGLGFAATSPDSPRLPTGGMRLRDRESQARTAEFNVANERKGCPRSA